jgi:dolichol-phosphate mannosyltransferase
MKLELSVIVPTYNEAGNVIPLYNEIKKYLNHTAYEIIFVDDDSKDNTLQEINALIENYDNVRLIRRINKRGLSSACIEGFSSSNAKYLAVIDADLQHDPSLLKQMLKKLETSQFDIIVASRFLKDSSVPGLSQTREKVSIVGNMVSRVITGVKLSDPLSGYFMIKKETVDQVIHKLSGKGFKILLDIFITFRINKINLNYLELPTIFRERTHGQSKLDFMVMLEFLVLLLDKIIGKHIPVRFVLFVLVGLSGLALHLLLLTIMVKILGLEFIFSQTIAAFVAMGSNFFINNAFTYRDKKLTGFKIVKGLISFYLACSIGALINVIVASFLFEKGVMWLLSGFLGCVVGSIWNYAITAHFTWKKNE